jgi:hypothetical protein
MKFLLNFTITKECLMRELTSEEITQVSGRGMIADYAADFGAVGTVVGYAVDSTIMGATRGGLAGAMLGASFGFGYGVGTQIYNWGHGS